jgi:hypothetical protein
LTNADHRRSRSQADFWNPVLVGLAHRGSDPAPRGHAETVRALHQLANRLVGILHGCLKTGTVYDETTAAPVAAATPARRRRDRSGVDDVVQRSVGLLEVIKSGVLVQARRA